MAEPLYTTESEADTRLSHLGYNASVHDLVVQAAHTELNRFLKNEGDAVRMWGWDPGSLHAADRYRIVQLLRSFTYQERLIVTALKRLDEQYRAYVNSSAQNRAKAEAFIASLNQAAARRAVDFVAGRMPDLVAKGLKDGERDRIAKALVSKWQDNARETDVHVDGSMWRRKEAVEQGWNLVQAAITSHLTPAPRLGQAVGDLLSQAKNHAPDTDEEYAELPIENGAPVEDVEANDPRVLQYSDSYLRPPFRRIHMLRSVVDFYDPEIARELGRRDGSFSIYSTVEEMSRPEDTTFKGSGFDMDLWRLKDQGYPRERISDGLLYDLVDTALAVQAEYQLQCFFVDRELAKVIDTRGKEEQWLYAKTADWAAERARAEAEAKAKAAGFWGLVGDILGLVSAVAGVLALIPVLTPIMGPIAIVTAVGSLGAHAAAASIQGDWDAATIAGLGADALAAIPFVGAVAKGAKGAWAAARMNKVANVVVNNGGRAFLGAIGVGRAAVGASDAAGIFDRIGKMGTEVVTGTVVQSQIPGKVLQGAVTLSTQVPLVVELSGAAVDQKAKDTATGTALTANIGQTAGQFDVVGVAKKAGTVSIERFARFFHR
ncbi:MULTISPECIES: hypothetical protein [Streptomyces]|uniref:hypothetical protein n=1 Tax=Streptomyces TaxID=1883 RepID=UPI00345B7748